MNSEQYLSKLRYGTLAERLAFMASEHNGPCGQSMTAMEANSAKKKNLKEAIEQLSAAEARAEMAGAYRDRAVAAEKRAEAFAEAFKRLYRKARRDCLVVMASDDEVVDAEWDAETEAAIRAAGGEGK